MESQEWARPSLQITRVNLPPPPPPPPHGNFADIRLECIAHFTKRTLVALTCADIGVDALAVEEKLISIFKKAKKWGAVLLLDEADIYREKRTTQDLELNSIASKTSET